jgi:hypothetical protein
MSITFSRSLRAIQNDRHTPSVAILVLLGLVLAGWMAWFFVGSLPVYVNSSQYEPAKDGNVVAFFAAGDLAMLRPGQQGKVSVYGNNNTPTLDYTVEVMKVLDDGNPSALIYIFGDAERLANNQGVIKIMVGKTSPARMFWNVRRE